MTTEPLLKHLEALEVSLHQPDVRRDPARVGELLHDAFVEIGRSGRCYERGEILGQLQQEAPTGSIVSQEFAVEELGDGVALLTYRSARVAENGEATHHALRSSIWVRHGARWRLRFHQATATVAFER